MTSEEQRIVIAEFCGITGIRFREENPDAEYSKWVTEYCLDGQYFPLPDYCNDLNAMHAAEILLSEEQREAYLDNLMLVTTECDGMCSNCGELFYDDAFAFAHATAAQKAEALLKAIGKWEDG